MGRRISINPHLDAYSRDTYAAVEVDLDRSMIDCALGINPYGTPTGINIGTYCESLADYPERKTQLIDLIVEKWSAIAALHPECVQLESGAFGVLERVSKLMLSPGDSVLGFAPQFPDLKHEVEQRGATYDYVWLDPKVGYEFDETQLIARMRPEHRFVYLDNPSNPTGQAIAVPQIERVVEAAANLGVAVVIDEAYGDYLPDCYSAISLIPRHDNIIIARTFSKGWGLAAMRVGYAVMSRAIVEHWWKICHPFPVSSIAQIVAIQAIQDESFLSESTGRVTQVKRCMLDALNGAGFSIPATYPSVPILTLMHRDVEVNLHHEFETRGVMTTDGRHFLGLARNSVRIRMPREVGGFLSVISDLSGL